MKNRRMSLCKELFSDFSALLYRTGGAGHGINKRH